MKIIALTAENIKKLVAVEIKPDGNMVQITGKNGQGKTSLLDAIFWALAGKSAAQSAPIRKGTSEAKIKLDLGDIVVKRTFKKDKAGEVTTSIQVESKEGARFPSPQAMLDSLLGALSFDPLAFSRMPQKEQFDTLRKFVPDVDFDAIDKAQKDDAAKRHDINRRAKELRAVEAQHDVPLDGPMNKIDESALIDEMEKAASHNQEIENRKSRRESAAKTVEACKNQAADILKDAEQRAKALIAEGVAKAKRLTEEGIELQKKLDEAGDLPEPIDISDIRKKLDEAKKLNETIVKRGLKVEAKAAADILESDSKEITARMENREISKRIKIAEASLPVKGISFGDGIVLLNDVPFEQASDAEQLRTSVAIAMSLNPKLRVIRVKDGSLLDEDSMKLLAEMADERDYQVWIERVDGSGKVGFVLEDGHVKTAVEA